MSYQFEDESALEELLNQQLDRRTKSSSANLLQSKSKVSTGPQLSAHDPIPGLSYSLDKHPLSRQQSISIATGKESESISDVARTGGKLSAWLNARPTNSSSAGNQATILKGENQSEEIATSVKGQMVGPTFSSENRDPILYHRPRTSYISNIGANVQLDDFNVDESLFESDRLQEMSKQRLILHITEQIRPHLRQLCQSVEKASSKKTEDLREQLEKEREKIVNIEKSLSERLRLEENKWNLLNKQLENRLQVCEQELLNSNQRNETHLSRLNEEFEMSIKRLREGYEFRLEEERRQFDEALKRREELHKLEMDSKLRINLDVNSLATMHKEWQTMVKTTISELDNQFKAVEDALDKQTTLVKGTNKDLTDKTIALSTHYDEFKRQTEQITGLVEQLTTLLPELDSFRKENESLIKQSINQLSKLTEREELLNHREQQLNKQNDDLTKARDSLNEDRVQIAIESNRIGLRQERLNELISSNEMLENKLITQNNELNDRQAQLQTDRASLDTKACELREQNYDLHLLRKRLQNEREKLDATQFSISHERSTIRKQVAEVEESRRRLVDLRTRLNKELEQLTRLQKSLVCSLCLNRLFPNDLTQLEVADDNPRNEQRKGSSSDETKQTVAIDRSRRINDVQPDYFSRRGNEGTLGTLLDGSTGGAKQVQVVGADNYNLELSRISLKRFERESKELAKEDRYVELLSSG